jgi:invasion protein IalB
MSNLKTTLAALLAFGLALPALAQETTTEAPAAAAADQEFPLDPAQPVQPTDTTKQAFGDWEIRCSTANPDQCVLYQLLKDAAGTPIVEVTMIKLPQGSQALAGVTAVTPLGTVLSAGLNIQIDENPGRQYPFGWCTPNGCFARFGLAADAIAMLKGGAKGQVAIFAISKPEQPVLMNLSLNGFTAGFDALVQPTGPAVSDGAAPPAATIESPVTGQ